METLFTVCPVLRESTISDKERLRFISAVQLITSPLIQATKDMLDSRLTLIAAIKKADQPPVETRLPDLGKKKGKRSKHKGKVQAVEYQAALSDSFLVGYTPKVKLVKPTLARQNRDDGTSQTALPYTSERAYGEDESGTIVINYNRKEKRPSRVHHIYPGYLRRIGVAAATNKPFQRTERQQETQRRMTGKCKRRARNLREAARATAIEEAPLLRAGTVKQRKVQGLSKGMKRMLKKRRDDEAVVVVGITSSISNSISDSENSLEIIVVDSLVINESQGAFLLGENQGTF